MHAHKMLKMECSYNDVNVAGVRITRPSGVSAKQWVDYWERLCLIMEREEDGTSPFQPSRLEEDPEE